MKKISKKTIILIPARLASVRLHRKILADINGHPLIWHVWQRCQQSALADAVYLAVDDEEVAETARAWGAEVLMTDPNCRSGTERIASLADHLDADLVLNVQGDEPLIDPALIDALIHSWQQSPCDMITAAKRFSRWEDLLNPNLVKAVVAQDGRALYFSRSPVPYVRDAAQETWLEHGKFWLHIGIYGYRRALLEAYPHLPESPLEMMEKLEQLRFLEAGYTIRVVETDYQPNAVDTAEDLQRVRKILGSEMGASSK